MNTNNTYVLFECICSDSFNCKLTNHTRNHNRRIRTGIAGDPAEVARDLLDREILRRRLFALRDSHLAGLRRQFITLGILRYDAHDVVARCHRDIGNLLRPNDRAGELGFAVQRDGVFIGDRSASALGLHRPRDQVAGLSLGLVHRQGNKAQRAGDILFDVSDGEAVVLGRAIGGQTDGEGAAHDFDGLSRQLRTGVLTDLRTVLVIDPDIVVVALGLGFLGEGNGQALDIFLCSIDPALIRIRRIGMGRFGVCGAGRNGHSFAHLRRKHDISTVARDDGQLVFACADRRVFDGVRRFDGAGRHFFFAQQDGVIIVDRSLAAGGRNRPADHLARVDGAAFGGDGLKGQRNGLLGHDAVQFEAVVGVAAAPRFVAGQAQLETGTVDGDGLTGQFRAGILTDLNVIQRVEVNEVVVLFRFCIGRERDGDALGAFACVVGPGVVELIRIGMGGFDH